MMLWPFDESGGLGESPDLLRLRSRRPAYLPKLSNGIVQTNTFDVAGELVAFVFHPDPPLQPINSFRLL